MRSLPEHTCIACHKKGYHSSKHRKAERQIYRNFVTAYFSGADMSIDTEDASCQSDEEAKDALDPKAETYISFIGATAAMGLAPWQY